ncbi:MAG: SMC-Scp complex subunit ScpB [Deferrisomatales bacterium]|nr:SMC-Scp complex subunit ScpB [Deferrisomatales bacterium]
MEIPELVRALEAVLFASAEPITLVKLQEVFAPDGVDGTELKEAVWVLQQGYEGRGLELREVASGYQLRTRPDLGPWLARLEKQRPVRFSRAALETLSSVAYRQPLTRAEIEEVRGVDCGGVLKTLLDRNLVRIVGKKDVPGRPLLYGTTRTFLEVFGLESLGSLPSLREIDEILAEQDEGVQEEPAGGEPVALSPESVEAAPE